MVLFRRSERNRPGRSLLVLSSLALILSMVPSSIRAVDDHTPPQITSFSLSPSTVNTDSADQQVTATMTLTDDLSGARNQEEMVLSPANTYQSVDAMFNRVSGDGLNGAYTATFNLPRGSEGGVWKVQQLSLFDNLSNLNTQNQASLEAQFGAGSASITNTATVTDVTPPQITAFSLSPSTVNTDSTDQQVTATMAVTDDLSGTRDQEQMVLSPANTYQSVDATFNRVSGDGLSGTYTATLTDRKSTRLNSSH